MTIRRVLLTMTAALLTTFALVSVAQPSVAATPTGKIVGVAALDGKGVAGIKARLLQSQDEGDSYRQIATAVTNSRGSYTFANVAVNADGLSYNVVFTDSTHRVVVEKRFVRPKANRTVTRNVTLERAAAITGTLSRADGTTPHNITAQLSGDGIAYPRDNGLDRYDDPIVRHVHTNGTFTFVGLPAGKYGVQFTDDSGTYLDQCYDNVAAKYEDGHYPACYDAVTPEATRVTVAGGQKANLNAQTMTHPANRISGTVKDTSGNVLKGIEVIAFPSGDGTTNGPLWSSVSHSTGNFRILNLPAAGWQLRAEDTSNVWAPQWYDRKSGQAGSTVLNVGPADVNGLAVTMLSRSIIKATGTAGNGSATFEVLTTRKAGGSRPGGTVTVRRLGVTKTVNLVGGRATVKLTGIPAGKRTFTVTYSGNSTTAGTSKTVVVTVK